MPEKTPEELADQIESILDQLGKDFVNSFRTQPDAVMFNILSIFGAISFNSQDIKSAIEELIKKDKKDDEIKQELQKRIDFNNQRLQNIDEFQPQKPYFRGVYHINGEAISLKEIEQKLANQLPENIIKNSFIPEVIFHDEWLVEDEHKTLEGRTQEEAEQRPDREELKEFKNGKRSISQYKGVMAGLGDPSTINVYNLDGRPPQKHLQEIGDWETREVYGLVIHEIAHALETLWDKEIFDEWIEILKQEQEKEPLTLYLEEYRNKTRETLNNLNHREEWAESLKIYCTNINYLKEKSGARYAFIKKYYPGIKESGEVW